MDKNELREFAVQKLIEEWKVDSKVDMMDLSAELARVYDLQAKYLSRWNLERFKLKSLELEYKKLKLQKYRFYLEGPTPDTKEWDYPASGKIFKPDVPLWMDADKQLQEMDIKITIANATVETLTYILDSVKYRATNLGNMIKREIWSSGQ
jgi:recombination/repair/ssDNA binding protein UvsY